MGGTESMQDIGPDMDDLLRKAADGYPLRQPADDWDKVASRLPAEEAAPVAPQKPKSKKRFLWLLLLLIPAGIAYYYSTPAPGTGNNNNKNGIASTNSDDQHQLSNTDHQLSTKYETLKASDDSKLDKEALANNHNVTAVNNQFGNNVLNDNTSTSKTSAATTSSINNNKYVGSGLKTNQSFKNNSFVLLDNNSIATTTSNHTSFELVDLYGVQEVNKNKDVANANLLPDNKASSVSEGHFDSISSVPSTIKAIHKNRFYYGAIAGVGFSSVKHYGLKKAGYDGGLFAGYQFTKNVAVEAGVLAAQKYYMSRGEDFNTKNLGSMMQPGMKMMEVNGSSQAISIPLHIKFDLNTKKSNKFFAKTGFSSLIMTKESNLYYAMHNGMPEMLKGIYKDNKNYFAATIDVAAGYEQNIKGKLYLRIEPYIQIPIKHVGVGDLPVTSGGLHVGISWPAH